MLGGACLDFEVEVGNGAGASLGRRGVCQEEEEAEELATETYTPPVHYAHSKVMMAGGRKKQSRKWSDDEEEEEDAHLGARSRTARSRVASNAATAALNLTVSSSTSTSRLSPPHCSMLTTLVVNSKTKAEAMAHNKILNQSMDSRLDLVNVEAEVGGGRWSMYGQTLKWWYDVAVGYDGCGGV